MIIIFLIFASIIIADFISAGMYGWIASPKLFWLRGFKVKLFFEINFWIIVSLALYSWLVGPEYFRQNGTIISIGTWDIHDEWIDEGFVPLFSGWAFWKPVIIYIPRT